MLCWPAKVVPDTLSKDNFLDLEESKYEENHDPIHSFYHHGIILGDGM